MAGNRDREGIRRAGLRDGPHGLRRADAPGHFLVGDRRARWDAPESAPDTLLERGALDVEREVEAEPGRLDEPDDRGHQPLEPPVAADKPGLREAILELPHQRPRRVAE